MRREIIIAVVALLLIGAAIGGYFACRCDRESLTHSVAQIIPPGWVQAATKKTPWLPFEKNVASEYTAEFAPGSKVVVVETEKGEQVEIGILPGGQVVTKEGVKATVYEKRPQLIASELRPFIFGGLGLSGGYAGGGIDVVRIWRLHGGVGGAVTYWPDSDDSNRDVDIGGIAKVSINIGRNIDLISGGGYGTKGKMAFGGVELAIE